MKKEGLVNPLLEIARLGPIPCPQFSSSRWTCSEGFEFQVHWVVNLQPFQSGFLYLSPQNLRTWFFKVTTFFLIYKIIFNFVSFVDFFGLNNPNYILSTNYLGYVSICESLFPFILFHNNTKLCLFFGFTKLKIIFYNNLLCSLSFLRTL